MTNREEIINKLEEEISLAEYWDEPYRTIDLQLLMDAFALLKERETKVITQEELKQFVGRPCWFESHGTYMGKEGFWIIPAIFRKFSADMIMSYTSVLNEAGGYGELGLSAYNKAWRCWTSQPTDEQRKAVKWE